MKSTLKYILFSGLFIFLLSSCSDDDLGKSIINTTPPELNEVDEYIREVFVSPYNIDVIYRWDERENDKYYNLVPPKMELVQPMLEVIDTAWIQPYVMFGGEIFFKTYCPKQINMVGSPGVNNDGTITQGTAEGGIKIVLYQVNDFDRKNITTLLRYFHVMHHEFGHILHQKKFYSRDYQNITGGYISEWYSVSDSDAWKKGFITPYSMSSPDEDFVEIIATMLTRSNNEWENYLNSISALSADHAEGVKKIRMKQAIVVNYFKTSWNIDIFKLQAEIYTRINKIVNE